jgi:carbon-monoxide dehydrogenase large subunit
VKTDYVGRRELRAEDVELVSGAAEFCGDIELDAMLDVAFHRADRPHARLAGVDIAAAAAIAGVHEVLTQADIGAALDLTPRLQPPTGTIDMLPRPLLARDVVRYVGEPIVAVVATSRYIAEDACDAALVQYENLPLVGDVAAAVAADAFVLHDAVGSNVLFEHSAEGSGVDAAFAAAHLVLERRFRVGRLAPAPMENRGIVARPTADGVEIWYSTQTPYVLQRTLSELLDLDADQIRVICPHVGGGFGQKSHVYPEDVLVPWLALRHGRAVRWLEDRSENLIASCHARDQILDVRVAVSQDAEILALDADITVDVGAYGVSPHGQLVEVLGTPNLLSGPYRIPAIRFRARAVATNKAPGGGYRGVGFAAAVFVHERVVDIVAHEMGLDAVEVRRRNLVGADEMPWLNAAGMVYDSGNYDATLDLALERIGADELDALRARGDAEGKLVGLGICCFVEPTGIGSNAFQRRGQVDIAGYEEARISITPDGRVLVRPSVPNTGQGSSTAFAQIVADALQQDIDRVEVRRPDTAAGPDGSGAFASRGTVVGGGAMLRASAALRLRMVETAARLLRVLPDEVRVVPGALHIADDPERRVSLPDLVAGAEGYLDVCERYDPTAGTTACGAHACLVEVDPEVGAVTILRYVIVGDSGRLVNPMIAEGQAHGSTAQGIGAALLEQVVFDDSGQPQTGSFADYMLPTATDVPGFVVDHLDHRPVESISGFKGVGEGGTIAAPAAVVNAIANATGREFNATPVTPESIAIPLAVA